MRIQTTGYVKIGDEDIFVLVRTSKTGVSLKQRKTGKKGIFLEDESIFLTGSPEHLEELKRGNVLFL